MVKAIVISYCNELKKVSEGFYSYNLLKHLEKNSINNIDFFNNIEMNFCKYSQPLLSYPIIRCYFDNKMHDWFKFAENSDCQKLEAISLYFFFYRTWKIKNHTLYIYTEFIHFQVCTVLTVWPNFKYNNFN